MKKTVTANGQEINLPDDFTWILFRHGDKTNQSPTRGGELTPLGRKQIWSTTWQLIDEFGQDTMDTTVFLSSPVHRVQQSDNIALSAIGRNPEEIEQIDELEWGPNDGHNNDLFIIKKLIVYTDASIDKVLVVMGHNGLFENIAQIIHPRDGGWVINPGEAFIITPADIEVIRPKFIE